MVAVQMRRLQTVGQKRFDLRFPLGINLVVINRERSLIKIQLAEVSLNINDRFVGIKERSAASQYKMNTTPKLGNWSASSAAWPAPGMFVIKVVEVKMPSWCASTIP